ncbi:LysR family transcriptional regulator [Azorhizobium caulinodans]|uniref:LysR family transcriptional regulator n=1 Tax=Azorhizobium caulinodans TaxID=7 RepID=UPI002FBD3E0B
MELRHLRHFVAVAEELHFTRGAQRAGIEQSPLSRSIKTLERRLGVVLFERTRRSTKLTPAGERLLAHARALLASADEARIDVRTAAAAGDTLSHLHLAICDGVPLPRLARLISEVKQENQQVVVHVHEASVAQIVQGLRSGFLDAALTPESGYGKGILSEAVWRDPPIALMPSGHPLAGKKRIELSGIVKEPLILSRPDTGLSQQSQIEQLVRTASSTPDIVSRTTTLPMLVTLVLAGYGIGIATAAQLEAVEVDGLALRPLSDAPADLKTWLMVREGTFNEPLSRFIERARTII